MRVLLIHPSRFFAPTQQRRVRLRVKSYLVYLYSYLRSNGIHVNILDLEADLGIPKDKLQQREFLQRAEHLLRQKEYDIIGISCYTSFEYLSAMAIAGIVRKLYPRTVLVVGGHHPTALPGDFITDPPMFDYVVRGEGEIALLEICSKGECRPVSTRVINGVLFSMEAGMDYRFSAYPHFHKGIGHLFLNLSRGCPFSCNFCCERSLGSKWRSVPVENAMEILEKAIREVEPKVLRISDPCFGVSRKWRRELLTLMASRWPRQLFWLETRVDILGEEDIKLISKINMLVGFGIESFSPRVLQIMGKAKDGEKHREKTLHTLTKTFEHGLSAILFLMFNHPGETLQTSAESLETLQYIVEHYRPARMTFFSDTYRLYPGNQVYNNINYYKETFGTRVLNDRWWAQECDHMILSGHVIPSKLHGNLVQQLQTKTAFYNKASMISDKLSEYWDNRFRGLVADYNQFQGI